MPERNPGVGLLSISSLLQHGLFALFAVLGLMTLKTGLTLLWHGDPNRIGAALAVLIGFVFAAVGLGFFYFVHFKGPRLEARREALRARDPHRPWMMRSDWAARRMVHSNAWVLIFSWIWVVGWCGGIGLIVAVNHDRIKSTLAESWVNYLLVGIFAVATLIGLRMALHATLTWWRFGRSELRIDTLPGYVGDRFRGKLLARLTPASKEALKIELRCEKVRIVETLSHGKRRRKLKAQTLSDTSSLLDGRRISRSGGGASIPIDIPIPVELPPSTPYEHGEGVRWILTISSTSENNASFVCTFEIPVYDRRLSNSVR